MQGSRRDPPTVLEDGLAILQADGIVLWFDPTLGFISSFGVIDQDRVIAPLHTAPWVDTDEELPPDAPPHLARLGGDFFCAPFGVVKDDVPLHGWPPNSAWKVAEIGQGQLKAELVKSVQGARLTKVLTLQDGHPFVYQDHCFVGGQGQIAASNHANVSVQSGAVIRTSPKRSWETPALALEAEPAQGRSALCYPARVADVRAFPALFGTVDLTAYPWGERHEDFVVSIDAPGHSLGWTAVTRLGHGDLFLSLRNAAQVPMTALWQSNGGRDYPPWSGRHTGCLGVEEAIADNLLGVSTSQDLTGPGKVQLGGEVHIRHVIGAIDWPSGEAVEEVASVRGGLGIKGEGDAERVVPFDASFLGLGAA